ncbi:MAG TPA: thiamine pyrophosphate-binding protein, partial [Nitrososphaeraceae archaeon]|nr:thiamine pyrophosphate-binding protein [Nitrososphaeraceae archaeon]
EENADLMVSLADSKNTIKFILVRHEQAAAFLADMYGRLTQKVGVSLSTLGPGATAHNRCGKCKYGQISYTHHNRSN